MSIWKSEPYRSLPEVSEAVRLGDRADPVVRLAIARWEGDALRYATKLFEPIARPQTHFVAYRRDREDGFPVVDSSRPLPKRYPADRYRWEERPPSRRVIAAYERNEASREAAQAEYREWAKAGLLDVAYGFDISQVDVCKVNLRDTFCAYWKGMEIARIIVWHGIHDNRPDAERSAFKVYVEESFRRRKVATKLYDYVEVELAQRGLYLMPSPALSDDGYAFWGSRAPERLAMRQDPPKRQHDPMAFGVS